MIIAWVVESGERIGLSDSEWAIVLNSADPRNASPLISTATEGECSLELRVMCEKAELVPRWW